MYIKHLFNYNPDTGEVTGIPIHTDSKGYYTVCIRKRTYALHRLIWKWVTGKFPKNTIDHINRVRTDNRWCNLREATHTEQKGNYSILCTNTSGIRGVSKRGKKWRAVININNKHKHLGYFKTQEEALAIYNRAAKEHFGDFYTWQILKTQ